jgi:hypothetical protein
MNMSNDAHDLFFRTEQRHDDMVWAAAVRCPATATSGESPEEIADQALTRAWLAIVSRGSASLPNVAALLSYLRICVTHTAFDANRACGSGKDRTAPCSP